MKCQSSILLAGATLAIAGPFLVNTLPLQQPMYPPYRDDRYFARVAAVIPSTATILLAGKPSVFDYYRATFELTPRRVVLSTPPRAAYLITWHGDQGDLTKIAP